MRFHKLQNVQIALDFLKHRQVRFLIFSVRVLPKGRKLLTSFYKLLSEFCVQVKLVNIRNDDIADGNPKLTLGLIWTIILHFQVKKMDTLSLGVFTGKNLTIRYIVTSGSSSSVFSQTTENRTRSMLTQRSLTLNENLCSVFILCAAAVVVHTWS